uniref:CSON014381 protein n=1 Tax=Culicoides sonorensis TaxID=179676 RepID=A0A336MBI8_CULSO
MADKKHLIIIISIFAFILLTILIILPFYLWHIESTPKHLTLTESDIIEVKQGVSSILCRERHLKMNRNTTFNAFQVKKTSDILSPRKLIHINESMKFPGDEFEYKGFFLLNGATIDLRVCTRQEVTRLLVVKDGRSLSKCEILKKNKNAQQLTEQPMLDDTSDELTDLEESLLTCYDNKILVLQYFPPLKDCHNTSSVNKIGFISSKLEVISDAYYYYIFYSENNSPNDINVIFDIYQPTYEYANISKSVSCINRTVCEFPVNMFSNDKVIVEIPIREGIRNGTQNQTEMLSICVPRTSVFYIIIILGLITFIIWISTCCYIFFLKKMSFMPL